MLTCTACQLGCFNGAMPFQAWILLVGLEDGTISHWLQWGHALSGMDTIAPERQIPPLDQLQWGHALSGMDTCRDSGDSGASSLRFNGAMPFQAWIQDVQQYLFYLGEASMGPCPFRHGYAACAATSHLILGALQWGHALSGMDTWCDAAS